MCLGLPKYEMEVTSVAAGDTGYYEVSVVLHWLPLGLWECSQHFTNLWVDRTGPRLWLRGAGTRSDCFRICSQTEVGRLDHRTWMGVVSLWVPGQAGLLPDCSCEGLKLDYGAAPRCKDRSWSMGLLLGHGQVRLPRRLFPDHGLERICSWTKLEGLPQVHRQVCLLQGARWAGIMAEKGWSWAMSHFRVRRWD